MGNVSTAQNQQLQSAASAAGLRIHLLGPVTITSDGRSLAIASKKARALLGYLALREGTEIARNVLAGLLWGERGENQARASLRQTLSELRGVLGDPARNSIIATKDTVTWVPGSAWIDARELEAATGSEDVHVLREAAAIITGELMEGLAIGEAGFEQWLASRREHFRLVACSIHARLMELAEHNGGLEEALSAGLALLVLDPLQEYVHRALMRIYAAQGRHDAALAQYERCRHELATQLGVSPEPETEDLARSIRNSRREGSEKARITAPVLPHKPSVAVLPFTNLTSDREQDFFADGMTEDIITALSRVGELFVISRNSSSLYKGLTVPAEGVARELGVRFLLGGSIRVAANRLRVTVHLIDGISGGQIWAEHYEGALSDIFAVQDQITRSIALALQVKLTRGESARLWEGQTQNLRAWEKMVLARDLFLRCNMGADNREARRLLEEALSIDPNYTGAIALLGLTYWWDARFNISIEKEHSLRLAEQAVERVLRLNPEMASGYMLRGGVAFLRDQHDEAVKLCERAVGLAPNDCHAVAFLGLVCVFAGENEKAAASLKTAMRLSPHYPSWYTYVFAMANLWIGNLTAAQQAAEAYLQQEPADPFAYTNLATVYGFQHREADAARIISELKGRLPRFGADEIILSQRYKDRESLNRVVEVLRRAGLPN